MIRAIAVMACLLFVSPSLCQEPKKDDPKQPIGFNPPEEKPAGTVKIGNAVVEVMLLFVAGILVFGFLAIVFVFSLAKNRTISENGSVRLIGLIFLATLAACLVVGGYSQSQIATVMGLLGTLAGYVLGQRQAEHPKSDAPKDNPRV